MQVLVNGDPKQIQDGLTLKQLIAQLSLNPLRVAVEVNRNLVRRAEYEHTVLQDGDALEIVTLVGGG